MRSETSAAPDRDEARKRYERLVKTYVLWKRPTERLRRDAIAELGLQPGSRVIDVGCGTGFSFTALQEQLGGQGRLIGIDYSGEMLERARGWVDENGWRNVSFIESAIEDFELDEPADAALFFFTHDILQTPQAIKNVLRQVKPGGRIAVGGMKFAGVEDSVRNRLVRIVASPYVTTFENYDRPWEGLAAALPELQIKQRWGGSAYLARATIP